LEHRSIKGKRHYVFENFEEFSQFFDNSPPDLSPDWREAKEGDWVWSDDGHIVQILKRGAMKHHGDRKNYRQDNGWVRTIVGTFVCNKKQKMDTNFALHPNRYTFSGKTPNIKVVVKNRKNLTNAERAFAFNIAAGMGLQASYRDAFGYDGPGHKAQDKAFLLLKQERVVTEIQKSITQIAADNGIDHAYIIKGLKEIFEDNEDVNAALRALIELGKAVGTLGAQPKTLTSGVAVQFKGFEEKHLGRLEDGMEVGEAEVVSTERIQGKEADMEEVEES